MLLLVRWRLQVKQADEREILQVGAYAAKVDPRCADLRLATGDPRTVGYPLTSDTRLAHTTKPSYFIDPLGGSHAQHHSADDVYSNSLAATHPSGVLN